MELFDRNTTKDLLLKLSSVEGITIAAGLSEDQIAKIEDTFKTSLPVDLKIFLSEGVPTDTLQKFPDWHGDINAILTQTVQHIHSIFSFDILENNYWHEAFGTKPDNFEDAIRQCMDVVESWPPLIPIYTHRYMTTDLQQGNPVLSIQQASDTIYYGSDLENYIQHEFLDPTNTVTNYPAIKHPRFWSAAFDLV